MTDKRFSVRFFDECPHTKCQQPGRLQSSVPYVANVELSGNLVRAVVVVAAVLGSDTAEALGTPRTVTRGTRGSRSAKYGRSLRELAASSQTRLKDYIIPMLLARDTPKQS